MLSSTLKQYQERYSAELQTYLEEYQDNTKAFFLQSETTIYQAYQNALTKISNQMKMFTRDELNKNLVHKNIAADLKKINSTAYNAIITANNTLEEPPEGVLSLYFEKTNTIHINEKALENHIKSSIVILKFISEEYEEAIQTKSEIEKVDDNEVSLHDSTEYQIDQRLGLWMKNYEKENEYIQIPLAIEEKKNWVTDNYKNYEERYYKYQLEICDIILNVVKNDNQIIAIKAEFKTKLNDLRNNFPLPDTDINKLISEINSAFHLLEKFMDGTLSEYKSFLFNDHFTLLFNELVKPQNNKQEYINLKDGYFELLYQISIDHDKSTFINQDAYSNQDFNRDCNEIDYLSWYRLSEFMNDDVDDVEVDKPSIMKLILNSKKTSIPVTEEISSVNPYPRIFKTNKSFELFKNLVNEFGDTKENLANYSFVYHRMKKDKLIFDDFQKLQFTYFLIDFNISIDRIKRLEDIGKIAFRESIFAKAKQ